MTDFSINDVLEWARTKPASEAYDFCNAGACALGQFARERRGFSFWDAGCEMYRPLVSRDLFDAALGRCDRWPTCTGKTFGDLVVRLETLVQEAPAKPSIWLNPTTYIEADLGSVPA